jgi:hypothetical protein
MEKGKVQLDGTERKGLKVKKKGFLVSKELIINFSWTLNLKQNNSIFFGTLVPPQDN